MIERDNLHYSFRPIDGYNKAINIVISPREPGKTTAMWMDKIYLPWKKNFRPWIYLVRQSIAIDDALIDSIFATNINKFTDDAVTPIYKTSSFKNGIVDVYIKDKLFIRIVSLNIKMDRIKKAVLPRIGGVFMDEFIINPKFGEKYLPKEFDKIEEAYTTWRREAGGVLKMYFCGNPYSLFNPLFVGLDVDIHKLKRNSFYVGDEFVIHWAILTPELRRHILELNPFYKFDEEYSSYALDGYAINDTNIRLASLPRNYHLAFVLKMSGKYIGIFQNNYVDDLEDKYFCKFLDEVSTRRTIYCFDFEEMVERCILLSLNEKWMLQRFKEAMRKRLTTFEDINVYYFMEEVYSNI